MYFYWLLATATAIASTTKTTTSATVPLADTAASRACLALSPATCEGA